MQLIEPSLFGVNPLILLFFPGFGYAQVTCKVQNTYLPDRSNNWSPESGNAPWGLYIWFVGLVQPPPCTGVYWQEDLFAKDTEAGQSPPQKLQAKE